MSHTGRIISDEILRSKAVGTSWTHRLILVDEENMTMRLKKSHCKALWLTSFIYYYYLIDDVWFMNDDRCYRTVDFFLQSNI
jgi:hypothetical protein